IDVLVGSCERAGETVEPRRRTALLDLPPHERPAREVLPSGTVVGGDEDATPRFGARRSSPREREAVALLEGTRRGGRHRTARKERLLDRGQERGEVPVEARAEAVGGCLELEDREIVDVQHTLAAERLEIGWSRDEPAQDLLRRAVVALVERGAHTR